MRRLLCWIGFHEKWLHYTADNSRLSKCIWCGK